MDPPIMFITELGAKFVIQLQIGLGEVVQLQNLYQLNGLTHFNCFVNSVASNITSVCCEKHSTD